MNNLPEYLENLRRVEKRQTDRLKQFRDVFDIYPRGKPKL